MTAFLDTNILIFLTKPDEAHHAWAMAQLESCQAEGPALISDIVYAEFSAAFSSRAEVDEIIEAFGLERLRANDEALFRAGKAFLAYKKTPGTKNNVLPDFLIGAHAEVTGIPLITTNPTDFSGYFPSLELISP